MAILNKGHDFSDGEQVTSTKLDAAIDSAVFTSQAVDNVSTQLSGGAIIVKDGGVTLQKLATALKDALYPVGSIYTNATDSNNPATLIGFGTWVAFGAGKVPVGIDSGDTDFDTAEETGGAKTHTLTETEIPSHNHDTISTGEYFKSDASAGPTGSNAYTTQINGGSKITGSSGGDQAHNNLQPYIVVYMWKRTA